MRERCHKEDFLDQKSIRADGSENDLHQRLVKARDAMRRRMREHAMFTFMDSGLGTTTPVPTTNNVIESVNARIRAMLRDPRPVPDPAHQGCVLVVPPVHRVPRKRRMAHQARMARRTNRTPLPTGTGAQRRTKTTTIRHPGPIWHRHRLERIPRQYTMEKHQLARHTFWPMTPKESCSLRIKR